MSEAEFAILVRDAYQGNGFGGELLRRLVQIGRDEKLRRIVATILGDNVAMQHVSRQAGFALKRVETEFHAELDLSASSVGAADSPFSPRSRAAVRG